MMANANVDEKVLRAECDVAQNAKEKRILIVATEADTLKELLKRHGFTNYVLRKTTEEALSEFEENGKNLDIIILTMKFPRGSKFVPPERCPTLSASAGVGFIDDINVICKMRKGNLPAIIGYRYNCQYDDFYKMYKWVFGDLVKLPKEFIGQGKSAEEVIGILKNFLNL